jgi:AcrR family transcriptional regulator
MARPAYSEQEIQQTRLMLVEGAMSLYLERGLDSITLRQVAERIGMSHTLVYRYFDSKEALLAELRVACLQDYQRVLALALAAEEAATPLARLRSALTSMLVFGCDEPAKYRLVFAHEQPSLDDYPRLKALRDEVFAACLALVQAAASEARADIDPLLYTHGFWSLLHGMLSLHTAGQLQHGLDLDHMAGPLLETLLAPLSPTPKPRRTRG